MSAIGRWLGYTHMDLVSPLPAEECVRRLEDSVEGQSSRSSGSLVAGRVDVRSFQLRKRLKNAHNSFQTYLRGEIERAGETTRITCRFGPHAFVVVFMAIWLAIACAIAIPVIAGAFDSHSDNAFFFMPVLFPVFGIGLVIVGRRMARDERDFLIGFLRDTIEARGTPIASMATTKTVDRRSS